MLVLIVPQNYTYALMGLAANFLWHFICNFLFVFPARGAVFNKESLAKHEGTHKEAFPDTEID